VVLQFLPLWILVHNGLDPASFSQTAQYLGALDENDDVMYSFAQFGLSLFSNRTAFLEAYYNMTQMAKDDLDFASGEMTRCSPDPVCDEYQINRINFVDAMKQDAFSHDELRLDASNIGTKMFLFLVFEQTSMLNEILKKHVEENHSLAEPHFDPFEPKIFCQKHYEVTATMLDTNSVQDINCSYQHSLTMATAGQQLFSGQYLRDFHFIEYIVQDILLDSLSLNKVKLDGVAELVNKLANDIMYQDTDQDKFSKNVWKNYPSLGKLGPSKHEHVVSWKQDG
jgi:hypothetical protein